MKFSWSHGGKTLNENSNAEALTCDGVRDDVLKTTIVWFLAFGVTPVPVLLIKPSPKAVTFTFVPLVAFSPK